MQSPHTSNRIHGFARFHAITFLVILGLSLIASSPTAQAQTAVLVEEGFEDCAQFEVPPCLEEEYTYSTSGSGSAIVSTQQANNGNKSLRLANTAGGQFMALFERSSGFCPTGLQFSVFFTALPEINDPYVFGISSLTGGSTAESIRIEIEDDGTVGGWMTTNSGSVSVAGPLLGTGGPLVAAINTWYDFSLNCIDDDADDEWEQALFTESTTESSVILDLGVNDINDPLAFFQARIFTTPATKTVFIDDLTWSKFQPSANSLFCANPIESNFGWDFVQGVVFDESTPVTIGPDDAFEFAGTDSTNDAVAKGFNPGSEMLMVRARIEAATEGTSSVFRVAFTTGATVLSAGAAQDSSPSGADFLAASDGKDGGNFDNHVQVVLQESGSAWTISAWYNVGGAGLTQIPGSVNYAANPNDPATFQVVVNSGTSPIPASVDDHTIPEIGDQAIGIQDAEGNHILSWPLPSGLFSAEWKDQWFIGQGTSAFSSATYLDDTEQLESHDSTCLWDLLGTATATGSEGLVPGSTVVQPPPSTSTAGPCTAVFCPPAEGVGGLSSAALSLFLGIVIVAAFAASMSEKTGSGAAGIAIFALLGLFLAYALGFIQLWVIVALTTLGVAAIFLGIRSGSQGTGM